MEQSTLMLMIAVVFPVISAILAAIINNFAARKFIMILTAVIMSVNAAMLFTVGDFSFTPANDFIHNLIIFLDFLILIYILYAGIARKNILVIVFGLLQIIPLGGFELFRHAEFYVTPTFHIDSFAKIVIAIISVIGSIICVYGVQYIKDYEVHHPQPKSRIGRFLFWCVLFLGAMNGLVASNNLYYIYFFWEVTTLCSYLLIGHDLTKEALDNAARALWINSLGGTAFCFAILYLYTYVGGHEALSLQHLIKGGGASSVTALLPACLLVFAGFTKSAQFPFQSWLLGAMVAPTPVSALLHSSTMVKAGVYLVLRMMPIFALEQMGKTGIFLGYSVAIVGAVTFLAGSLLAISQTTGKKVLAYSTIANLGLIIACAGLNTPISLTAAVTLIIFHAVSKALLFLCAGTVEHIVWSREIDDMQGLVQKAPVTTFIMGFAILTMFLPPFGMLFSKWLAVEAASALFLVDMGNKALMWGVNSLLVMIILMFAFASAATIVFWSQWLGAIIQSKPHVSHQKEKFNPGYDVPQWILLGMVVLLGLLIGLYNPVIMKAVSNVITAGTPLALMHMDIMKIAVGSGLTGNVGFQGIYPVMTLFLLLIGVAVPWFAKKVTSKEISPPYLCGDQVMAEGASCDAYMTAKDKPEPLRLSSYYFKKYFGETFLNPIFNSAAMMAVIFMFGIVLGVTLK